MVDLIEDNNCHIENFYFQNKDDELLMKGEYMSKITKATIKSFIKRTLMICISLQDLDLME